VCGAGGEIQKTWPVRRVKKSEHLAIANGGWGPGGRTVAQGGMPGLVKVLLGFSQVQNEEKVGPRRSTGT